MVWIDIPAKEKFSNLRKKIYISKLLFFFLVFICFLFEFCIFHFSFILYFFYKVLSIMNRKEINELFHRVQNRLVAQVIPTWENLAPMQAQTPMTQQDYNFGGVDSFNSSCYVSQLKKYIPSYHHPSWGTYDNFSYEYPSM